MVVPLTIDPASVVYIGPDITLNSFKMKDLTGDRMERIEPQFDIIDAGNGRFIKAWKRGVAFEESAIKQLTNSAQLPFVRPYLAAMPDTHWGMGSTVGSVIPMVDAIIPAAVGVDIGCGIMAVRTNLDARCMPESLAALRRAIEDKVPHGRTNDGGPGDRGAWNTVPEYIDEIWAAEFAEPYSGLASQHPGAWSQNATKQLGTLGTGNHFIEVCLDNADRVWITLHSGSRGMGNRIGSYFTKLAKQRCAEWFITLPDPDLAYFPRSSKEFGDYIWALNLAQKFAWRNREIMMDRVINAMQVELTLTITEQERVHCHHNYMNTEVHFGKEVMITRKGAVSAQTGEKGIIPGSMGARSYIVEGLGSVHSYHSCSHGAGRAMGREAAKKAFTVEQHIAATAGVECHKGIEVLDETPGAYKSIDAVMAAQSDLVKPLVELRQIVCVKGLGDTSNRGRRRNKKAIEVPA